MNLEQENIKLKAQLKHAQEWMKREIDAEEYNHRETIEEKIYSFFSAESLSHFPTNGVESIISAELIYQHVLEGEDIDGMGVILSYQKLLDAMIELYITKGFRKYISKHSNNIPYTNDPLEKSLRLIIEKKHIFSLGRIYQSLQIISSGKPLLGYLGQFSEYLKSRKFLQKSLLEGPFLLQLQRLIDLHAVTDKRHSGSLSKKDTLIARNIIIGDFTDTNSLLYIIAASQNIDI